MRFIIYVVTLSLVFFRCSQKEQITLNEELQKLGKAPQYFKILNNKVDTIKTLNGVALIIQPNSFVVNDTEEKDSIQIELKEVFKKSDMVFNGLSTLSNGNLLESYGMIYLKATSENDDVLEIIGGKSIRVLIPNKINGSDGELFYGQENDSTLNWDYAGQNKDTTETIVTTIKESEGAEIREQVYQVKEGYRKLISDSSYFLKFRPGFDYAIRSNPIETLPPTEFYDFEIKNLGWINCDRFISITETSDLQINLKNYSNPIAYIIFSDINSVIELFFQEGKTKIENLPNGFTANIVVIDKINGKLVWTGKNLKLGTEKHLTLDTRAISVDMLKLELEKLDK